MADGRNHRLHRRAGAWLAACLFAILLLCVTIVSTRDYARWQPVPQQAMRLSRHAVTTYQADTAKSPPASWHRLISSLVALSENDDVPPELLQQIARARQQLFCKDAHPINLPNAAVVHVSDTLQMYVHKSNDAVSTTLQEGNIWEAHDMSEIWWALEQPLPDTESGTVEDKVASVFVDVGANVGAFTFPVAAKGYTVYAFEGMRDNLQLLRSSLCASGNDISERVTLFPYGAGAKHMTCYMISDTKNKGDGIPACDVHNPLQAQTKAVDGYAVRGTMEIIPADWAIQRDVKVMKVDVEGFEPFVIQGAWNLLRHYKVWYILLEFNPVLLKTSLKGSADEPGDFVRDLHSLGYHVSSESFKGPFMSDNEINMLGRATTPDENKNLYLVHPDLQRVRQ